jgi:hypothetical protein
LAPRHKKFAALSHGPAGAADRIGSIEILDRIFERVRGDGPRLSERPPGRTGHPFPFGERRAGLPHAVPELAKRIEWERPTDAAGQGAQDFPILARIAGRKD